MSGSFSKYGHLRRRDDVDRDKETMKPTPPGEKSVKEEEPEDKELKREKGRNGKLLVSKSCKSIVYMLVL